MAKYRITYWKHIPQSITVEGDGRTIKRQLSDKIQNKIDAYAMAEGLTSTSDYASQYKRGEWIERDGAPEEVADAASFPTGGGVRQNRDTPTGERIGMMTMDDRP